MRKPMSLKQMINASQRMHADLKEYRLRISKHHVVLRRHLQAASDMALALYDELGLTQVAAQEAAADTRVTTRHGLLFDGDRQLGVYEADALARKRGYVYAEQLVRALENGEDDEQESG